MRLIRCLSDFKGTPNGVSLAIGNFDGFHKGHQAVVEAMKEKARIYDLTSAVMIFEPQPLEFFSKSNAPARLYSLRDKLQALEVAGVKLVFCMKFDSKFASMSAHDYVIELLHKRLGVKSVTVGTEFNFGKGGAYTIEDLKTIGSEVSMDAQAIDGVEIDGIRVSSTRIRSYLCEGRLDLASAALGRYYSISGAVVHGFAFGRTLGFATANVNINRRISPLSGVFAVKVFCPYGLYDGMANIGYRPTVINGQDKALLEVNLFDFNKDLYGKSIRVFFIKKIRTEQKFENVNALKEQLEADRLEAKRVLEEHSFDEEH